METKDRREAVWTEILYRREKQWSIFSWAASLLLASIGGIVALATNEGFELSALYKGFLALALFLLTLYAAVWLGVNRRLEMKAVEAIKDLDAQAGIPCLFPPRSPRFRWVGYRVIVGGIGVVAVATALFAPVRRVDTLSLSFNPGAKPIITLSIPGRVQHFNDVTAAMDAFQEEAKKRIP